MRTKPVNDYCIAVCPWFSRYCSLIGACRCCLLIMPPSRKFLQLLECRKLIGWQICRLYFVYKYRCGGIVVSVSVCLSVRSHSAKTTCRNFIKFTVHVTRDRGSVLFWRQCDTRCISGFVDDVTFSRNKTNGQNQTRHVSLVEFARWRHRRQSMPSSTASCYCCRTVTLSVTDCCSGWSGDSCNERKSNDLLNHETRLHNPSSTTRITMLYIMCRTVLASSSAVAVTRLARR